MRVLMPAALRLPLNHPVGVLLRHPVRRARRAARGAEQRPVFIAPDARRRDVFIEVGFQLGDARRFVFLAALLMQPHPSAPPLAEVIPTFICSTALTRAKV